MFKYLIKKYWKGPVLAALFFWWGWTSQDNFNDAMILVVGMAFMVWMFRVIYLGAKGSPKIFPLAMTLFTIANLLWSICTLKPLRKLIRRWRDVGLSQKPHPYLSLYGSITDTHGMLFKLSPGIFRSKIPAAKAALWRLVARGAVEFDLTGERNGEPAFRLKEWTDSPSDGIDQAFEQTMYRFLELAATKDQEGKAAIGSVIEPKRLREVVGYVPKKKKKKGRNASSSTGVREREVMENQMHFADLLNTSVSIHSYSKEEKAKMLGMKRFLKGLPGSFDRLATDPAFSSSETRLELWRVWPEDVAFGYVFGIGEKVLSSLSKVQAQLNASPTLGLILSSKAHRRALDRLMTAVAEGTPYAEDSASAYLGLLPLAWHADELYDL